jgi:hypothetical protein
MPTTVVKTIGSGRDYSTLQAWEDAAPANLVTADQVWEGRVYAEGGGTNGEWTLSSALTISGSTSDSTRFKRLTAAAGASFADASSKVLRYDTAKGVAIRATANYTRTITVSESNTQINRLQVKVFQNNSQAIQVTSTNVKVYSSIIEGGSANVSALLVTIGGSATVENCVLIGGRVLSEASPTWNNCTFLGNSSAGAFVYTGYGGLSVFLNCAIFGYSSQGSGVSSGSSYNATNLASFTGSSNVTSLTASSQFENSTYGASLDLRLKAGSALLDAGTSTGAPTTDIYGTARPQGSAYDIGAFELPASGIPTLSAATAVSITSTTATPRVTITF